MYCKLINWLFFRKERKFASGRATDLAVKTVLSGALTRKHPSTFAKASADKLAERYDPRVITISSRVGFC